MAFKSWMILTATLYLIIATELSITVAKPQRISVSAQTQPVRFHPISYKQYQSIMKLTSGKSVISEDRLINSNYRSLSSIRKSITKPMTNTQNKPQTIRPYPMCVIKTNIKSTNRRNRYGGHYGHSVYQSPYTRVMTSGRQAATARNDARVKCIVVTPPSDNCYTNPQAPGCPGYCAVKPQDPLCCNPNNDPECPGYCKLHPNDSACCDPNDDPECPGYCALHPSDPDCCDVNTESTCPGYCALHPSNPDCCDVNTESTCPGYCALHPSDPDCCDANTESTCPGYCALHPSDPDCCDANTESTCPGYCALHPNEPDCCLTITCYCQNNPSDPICGCPSGECSLQHRTYYPRNRYSSDSKYPRVANPYSYYYSAMPKYDYRYANVRQTGRALPSTAVPDPILTKYTDNQNIRKVVDTAVVPPAGKKAFTSEHKKVKSHGKNFDNPYFSSSAEVPKESSRARYDDYTQLYQQLYAGYGGLSPTHAAYGYYPYAGNQYNSKTGDLRAAQFHQQMQLAYGRLDNNDVQSGRNTDSSGEYSDKEENDEDLSL